MFLVCCFISGPGTANPWLANNPSASTTWSKHSEQKRPFSPSSHISRFVHCPQTEQWPSPAYAALLIELFIWHGLSVHLILALETLVRLSSVNTKSLSISYANMHSVLKRRNRARHKGRPSNNVCSWQDRFRFWDEVFPRLGRIVVLLPASESIELYRRTCTFFL